MQLRSFLLWASLISVAACSQQERAEATSDADEADVVDQCDEKPAAYSDVERELEALQRCDRDTDCGGRLFGFRGCDGYDANPINTNADTTRYGEVLNAYYALVCDTGPIVLYLEPCPFSALSPVKCEEEQCRFVDTPCSKLSDRYISEEEYPCAEDRPCRWFVGFDRDTANVHWDHPADGGDASTLQSTEYRCPLDGSLEMLVDGAWEPSGAVIEGAGSVTWFGLRYFVMPPH